MHYLSCIYKLTNVSSLRPPHRANLPNEARPKSWPHLRIIHLRSYPLRANRRNPRRLPMYLKNNAEFWLGITSRSAFETGISAKGRTIVRMSPKGTKRVFGMTSWHISPCQNWRIRPTLQNWGRKSSGGLSRRWLNYSGCGRKDYGKNIWRVRLLQYLKAI